MIDAPRQLKELQRLLRELEEDLRERVREVAELDGMLREQYRAAKAAGRTGDAYEPWSEEVLTQAAVAWTLGCVFVRFLEDNGLVELTPGFRGRESGGSGRWINTGCTSGCRNGAPIPTATIYWMSSSSVTACRRVVYCNR